MIKMRCHTTRGTNVPMSPNAPLNSVSVSDAQKVRTPYEMFETASRPMELLSMLSAHPPGLQPLLTMPALHQSICFTVKSILCTPVTARFSARSIQDTSTTFSVSMLGSMCLRLSETASLFPAAADCVLRTMKQRFDTADRIQSFKFVESVIINPFVRVHSILVRPIPITSAG